jgi:ADP-ribose pyrophosphatase YjhB (NUDIX family)
MTYLSQDLYTVITNNVPVVCVDVIPVRQRDNEWEIGTIIRGTGSQVGKVAILGGRVWHNETIPQAIQRHMQDGLSIDRFEFFLGNNVTRPFYIQQYLHQDSAKPPLGFDPSKHAIALTYMIKLLDIPIAKYEASEFLWLNKASVPAESGYNQHIIMRVAFEFLES